MSEETPKIRIAFEKSAHHVTIPVNGAWGGPSNEGRTLIAHLYTTGNTIPKYLKFEKEEAEEGRIDARKGQAIAESTVTREIQATLVLTPEAAISIGNWLVERGKQIKEENHGE